MAEKKETVKEEVKKTAASKAAPKAVEAKAEVKAAPKAAAAKTESKTAPKAAEAKTSPKAAPAPKAEAKTEAKAEAKPKVTAKAAEPKAKKEKGKKAPYVSKGEVTVELIHGTQGCTKRQIRTVQALGLNKIGATKVHKDNPATAGMIKLVAHLVRVEKVKNA